MHLVDFHNIPLEEYASQKLSLPGLPSRYIEITKSSEVQDKTSHNVEYLCLPFARTQMLEVPIKSANILCNGDHIKKVIEIIFEQKDPGIQFLPGDSIGIQPINKHEDVDFMLNRLGMETEADAIIDLAIMKNTPKKGAKLPNFLPSTTTYRNLLTHYLNVNSVPKKLFVRSLVECTEEENDKLLLRTLCSKEGAELYSKLVVERRLSFIDLLKVCSSCKPPMDLLIENLPRLLPRPYSIANSPIRNPTEVRIVFSVMNDALQKGLTTGMLEEQAETLLHGAHRLGTIRLYFREETNFKYSIDDLARNIVMIGVGCAVGPFLGFLEHKHEIEKELRTTVKDGRAWLFSGSRYRDNAIYRKEFQEFLKLGVLDEYFESYSRESDSEFKYVQDQISANAERFVNLILSPDTKIYVCADGREITENILKVVKECISSVCGVSTDRANEMINGMRTDCRYIEDLWL